MPRCKWCLLIIIVPRVFHGASILLRLHTVVRLDRQRSNRYILNETLVLLCFVVGDLAHKAKDEL